MNGDDRGQTVGVVGVGVMGGGMAANLLKKGWRVVVCDIDPACCARLASLGAEVADGPAEVARLASRTICMVETTAQSRDVTTGPGGLADGAQAGDVVLCASTIDPIVAKEIHDALAQRRIAMLDIPVSGGEERAVSGELTIMAGGDAAALEACRPVIEAFASRIHHMGPIGQGLAMKLVNNMMIHVDTILAAEAMVMGTKAGLDPQAMMDVIRESTGRSVAFDMRAPRYITGDFSPGGKIDISYKDQDLQTAFGRALGTPLFLANVTLQIYQMARAEGLGREDGSAIVKLYERWAGVQLGPR